MYFFTFETTIRISRSASRSSRPSTAAAVAADASPTTRRAGPALVWAT